MKRGSGMPSGYSPRKAVQQHLAGRTEKGGTRRQLEARTGCKAPGNERRVCRAVVERSERNEVMLLEERYLSGRRVL